MVKILRPAIILSGLSLLLPAAAMGQLSSYTLSSPDNDVQATIKVVGGELFYNLSRGGQTVIEDSRLGLIMQSGSEDLGQGIDPTLAASPVTSFNQAYPVLGWHTTAVNNYNAQTFITTKTGGNNDSAVEFRVFNDGLAFRYLIPNEGGGPQTVIGEATQWKFPTTAAEGWYQSGSNADYANTWGKAPVSAASGTDLDGEDRLLGPVVIKYSGGAGGYTAITESDYWGYSGMTYVGGGANTRTIKAAFLRDTSGWTVPAGSTSPWRTIVTSHNLNGLVNSDMITNVARPADATLYPNGVNTSWIKPGRSLWSWLDKNNVNFDGTPTTGSGINITNMKQYVDKAVELGFEYITVDSGWEAKPWFWTDYKTGWKADGSPGGSDNNASFAAMADLVAYAHARNIKIIAWKNSDDFYHNAATPDDFNTGELTTFLDRLDSIGVDGVKMDFIRATTPTVHLVGEYQRLLNYMATAYQEAAERQMVLDFHGAPKVAGQQLSFPNALTTEDVRGLESGALAAQDAALPFTTLLSGPSDYTPGLFSSADNQDTSNDENGKRDNTTWAHQMAMGVLITSTITHWTSGPTTIENALPNGSNQLEVFKNIPATWDETKVLGISEIGTLAAFARRAGNTWFLAMASGDASNPMTLNNIDLSFLGSGLYDATLLFDDSLVDEAFVSNKVLRMDQSYDLDVTMRRGGGFVAMFVPVPEPGTLVMLAAGLATLLMHYQLRRR